MNTIQGTCLCGGQLQRIEWCAQHNEVCEYPEFCALELFSRGKGCAQRKQVLECKKCGRRQEVA